MCEVIRSEMSRTQIRTHLNVYFGSSVYICTCAGWRLRFMDTSSDPVKITRNLEVHIQINFQSTVLYSHTLAVEKPCVSDKKIWRVPTLCLLGSYRLFLFFFCDALLVFYLSSLFSVFSFCVRLTLQWPGFFWLCPASCSQAASIARVTPFGSGSKVRLPLHLQVPWGRRASPWPGWRSPGLARHPWDGPV